MVNNKKEHSTIALMIVAVVLIFVVVGIVLAGFRMIKKNEEAKLVSAADTEYTEDGANKHEVLERADSKEDGTEDTEQDKISEQEDSDTEKVYLIKGNEKSSNRYEKAAHLSYTTTVKYTIQDLSILDSYGLKITRNEIYARHGRIFNDQELQDYFQRQKWYVPQTASNDFDESCLNEVEQYNVDLIRMYEQQIGGR